MLLVFILLVFCNLFQVVHPLFDKPISVSCSTSFDPSNWTHYAFIIQTLIMIVIVCFGLRYLYKRHRLNQRSAYPASYTNSKSFGLREIAPPYGQAPIPSSAQPVPFYAMIPSSAPPGTNHNTSVIAATTAQNIVS